ncbi:MAG: elongation factor P [Pseudomonadota bacterium]|nr:elongation factor P [Pseudomonadota bacterium]
MKVNANTLRAGAVIEHNGKLCVVRKSQILTPGKGGAFVQLEMQDIRTGNKMMERFRTQETVERTRLDEHEMTFLFSEGDLHTFMDKTSFEQVAISGDIIGDAKVFLQDGMEVTVQMHEGSPLSVELPATVILTITEADPVVKGQTASSSYKPAVLENGLRIMVPPHIGAGTRVVVDTAESTYIERAKDE